jgi:anti-anti-sigma factor
MGTKMALKIEIQDDTNKLLIDEDLTIYNAAEYHQALVEGFKADKNLEIDLSTVEEIDTSGLQLLAAISKQVIDNGAAVKFTACSDEASSALETSRFLSAINCEE